MSPAELLAAGWPALVPLLAVLLAVTVGYLVADRAARRSAWRRIAAERRSVRAADRVRGGHGQPPA